MNIEVIQASIVTQLQAAFTAASSPFQAKPMPDSEAEYRRAVANPISFVVYTGSTSPGVRSTNPVVQDRKLQFSVECLSRAIYGDAGLSAMRDIVEKALIGFEPTNCDRMYLVKDDIDKGEDSIWAHVFRFECMTMLVQDSLSDPTVVPSLSTLGTTFKNVGDSSDAENGEKDTITLSTP